MEYVELHARSAFSFLRGAATPEELIAVCAELKMPAMALLDNDGVYGAARFHLAGKKLNVKAHIGAEITVASFKSQVPASRSQPRRQNPECQITNSKFHIHASASGPYSHRLSKSLPANHLDEAARPEACQAGRMRGNG